MRFYDASKAPDPQAWLELDEQERIDLAIAYHRRYQLQMGQDPKMQVACDATVVPATLARLMREGLDRHDAVHAIASVLMAIVFDMIAKKADVDFNERYGRELAKLTAASWRAQAD